MTELIKSEAVLGRRYRTLALGILTLVAAEAFSRLGVSTALPSVVEELDGLAMYGWVFTAFTLANIFGLAVAGPIFDRLGILKPLLAGTVFFAGGLLIASLAPAMVVILIGRVFQGLGSGVLSIAAYAAISRGFPEQIRPKMLALNATAFTIPSLIGPVLAGLIAETMTWRWVFGILVPLAPLAVLFIRGPVLRIDESTSRQIHGEAVNSTKGSGTVSATQSEHPHQRHREDAKAVCGGLCLTVGLGAALTSPTLPGNWLLPAVIFGLSTAIMGLKLALPAGTLTVRHGLPANVVFAAALSLAFFTVDLFIPLALVTTLKISASLAGTVLAGGILGWVAGAYAPARMLTLGLTKHVIARIGAALVITGIIIIGLMILVKAPVFLAALGWIIAGFGAGTGFTVNSIAVLDGAGNTAGTSSSKMEIGNQIGIAVGTGLAGSLIATAGPTTIGLGGVFVIAAAGGLIALYASTRFGIAVQH